MVVSQPVRIVTGMDDISCHQSPENTPSASDEPIPFGLTIRAQGEIAPEEPSTTDEPIPFGLTVRARREIAPDELPDLRLVDGANDGAVDRPGDPRPAQARALRRSGLSIPTIADRLDVEELVVRAWTADTKVRARGGEATTRRVRARPAPAPAGAVGPAPVPAPVVPQGTVAADERPAVQARARTEAHREALVRLRSDPGFAGTVGLLAGTALVEPAALSWATNRPPIAARLLEQLRSECDLAPQQVRVVLRIGPGVAGDLVRHDWSRMLELPLERIVHTRWATADSPDALEAMCRITDPQVAATVAGWCDAFFDPRAVSLELAF